MLDKNEYNLPFVNLLEELEMEESDDEDMEPSDWVSLLLEMTVTALEGKKPIFSCWRIVKHGHHNIKDEYNNNSKTQGQKRERERLFIYLKDYELYLAITQTPLPSAVFRLL